MLKNTIIIILIAIIVALYYNMQTTINHLKLENTLLEYNQCLKENFNQRSYCASKLNYNYKILDAYNNK